MESLFLAVGNPLGWSCFLRRLTTTLLRSLWLRFFGLFETFNEAYSFKEKLYSFCFASCSWTEDVCGSQRN
jgi:hypothetical protein